jgi:KRAB domain-containing zinc finger protein
MLGYTKSNQEIKLNFFKKYICATCGKKFRKVEVAMQHEQVMHGKDMLYDCKKCNVGFIGMEQMRDHVKKFHSYNKMKEKKINYNDNNS